MLRMTPAFATLFALILGSFCLAHQPASAAEADELLTLAKVTRDNHFIYIRSPYWVAKRSDYSEIVSESIDLFVKQLQIVIPNKTERTERTWAYLRSPEGLKDAVEVFGKLLQVRPDG